MAGCCEHGDEPSGSIRCREFLLPEASQERVFSLELELGLKIIQLMISIAITTATDVSKNRSAF
jgi:hypothetical protein